MYSLLPLRIAGKPTRSLGSSHEADPVSSGNRPVRKVALPRSATNPAKSDPKEIRARQLTRTEVRLSEAVLSGATPRDRCSDPTAMPQVISLRINGSRRLRYNGRRKGDSMFFDPMYLLFVMPAFLLGLWAQFRIRSAYGVAKRMPAPLSGAAAARHVLD